MAGIFLLLNSPGIWQESGQTVEMLNAGMDITRTACLPLPCYFSSVVCCFFSTKISKYRGKIKKNLPLPSSFFVSGLRFFFSKGADLCVSFLGSFTTSLLLIR